MGNRKASEDEKEDGLGSKDEWGVASHRVHHSCVSEPPMVGLPKEKGEAPHRPNCSERWEHRRLSLGVTPT